MFKAIKKKNKIVLLYAYFADKATTKGLLHNVVTF